jgi:N-acetylglucosamine-6-sulfatase
MPLRSHHRIALGAVCLLALAGVGLAASGPLPGSTAGARAAAAKNVRPNIVLIQADDATFREFRRQTMPNTKRLLAHEGTTFSDYIAATSQCCPSRASLLTGQYGHNNGVLANTPGYPNLTQKDSTLPAWLRADGYQTAHVGKFMNGYNRAGGNPARVAPGWSDWQTLFAGDGRYYGYDLSNNGRRVHFGGKPEDYVTDVLNRKAVQTVRRYVPRRKPLYLQIDHRAPHISHVRSGRCRGHFVQPAPADEHRFAHEELPKPRSFNERDLSDKPSFIQTLPKLKAADDETLRRHWQCADASLLDVDRGVAQVVHAVKKAGELNKTVFLFTSDNGFFFGEHRIATGKVLPYEESLRLPFVMRVPKRYLGGAKRVRAVHNPVANIDIAPTILDLAHAQPCNRNGACRTIDGRSLMPLLRSKGGWPHGRGILTEYSDPHAGRYATCKFAGIRTSKDIYVQHSSVVTPGTRDCEPADERERYNFKQDPSELHNMCHGGTPASCPADKRQFKLELRLNNLRDCAGVAGRDQPVNGRPFCE